MSADGQPEVSEKKECKDKCSWKNGEAIPGCPIRRGLSEEEIGKRVDTCMANTAVKTFAGLGIGSLTSLILFKRRPWPIIFGTALGLGIGIGNCQSLMEGSCRKRPSSACPVKKSDDADQSQATDIKME